MRTAEFLKLMNNLYNHGVLLTVLLPIMHSKLDASLLAGESRQPGKPDFLYNHSWGTGHFLCLKHLAVTTRGSKNLKARSGFRLKSHRHATTGKAWVPCNVIVTALQTHHSFIISPFHNNAFFG